MEQFKKEIVNKYNRDDFEILSYTKRTHPIVIKCNCGNIFTLDRANRLLDQSRKNICPKCLIKKQPLQQEKSKNYQHKYNFWYEKIGQKKYIVLEPYLCYSKSIKLKCKKCGSVTYRKIKSLLQKSECLVCELKCNTKKTDQVFKQQILELEGTDYISLDEYKGAHVKIKIKHKCGFIYETTPDNFLSRGRRCPKCGKFESKGEKVIEKFLLTKNIEFESQKRFEDFKKYPYDFYLPSFNLLIEYNGIQHYEPVDFFGGEEQLIKQKEIDKNKYKYATDEIGQILIISYIDYNNINNVLHNYLSKFNDYSRNEK